MMPFLRLIRPINLLMILFTQYMVRFTLFYPSFKTAHCLLQVNEIVFALFSLAFVFMAAGGYIINDYYDVEIDKINKPDKVIIGKLIKPESAYKAYWIISILGVIMGSIASYTAGSAWLSSIFFFYLISLWLYSKRFKNMFLIGNLVVALCLAMVPLAAGCIEAFADLQQGHQFVEDLDISPSIFLFFAIILSVFAFAVNLAREIVKDIEDMEGDAAQGCRTMPIVIGKKSTGRIVQVLMFVVLCFIAYVQYVVGWRGGDKLSLIYLAILVDIPIIWIIVKLNKATEPKHYHKVSNWLKILMVTGISYLFVFAHLS